MNSKLSQSPAYGKVLKFIQINRHVTKDELHLFINECNLPAGMQIFYDLLAANAIKDVDGKFCLNTEALNSDTIL